MLDGVTLEVVVLAGCDPAADVEPLVAIAEVTTTPVLDKVIIEACTGVVREEEAVTELELLLRSAPLVDCVLDESIANK